MDAALRLFKAVLVDKANHDAAPTAQHGRGLGSGFIFTPNITVTDELVAQVAALYGRNSAQWNNALHKSFATVRDSSALKLRIQQLVHYLTTYGAEFFGVYDESFVYIPHERLDLPGITEDLRVMVIRGLTADELREELRALLLSGIALDEQSVQDATTLLSRVGGIEPADVGNAEVRCALYHALGMTPHDPNEFLRLLVFHATGSALVIKSKDLIGTFRDRRNVDLVEYFHNYEATWGLHRLGEVFLRNKPLFLAMRTNTELKRIINRIRKLAVGNHKPMPEDLLNSITGRIKNDDLPDPQELWKALDGANTFRKIRLAHALRFRQTPSETIVHRIRNGKSWVREFDYPDKAATTQIFGAVMDSIVNDLRASVDGKAIYIPNGLHYALPATAKQFTGALPLGTFVETSQDLVCGVHWTDVDHSRIDLDLSLTNADGKIGWDGAYRDRGNEIFFSGDLTSAPLPLGASEIYRIGRRARGSWLMHVNYYNYSETTPVPYKIMAGADPAHTIDYHRVVDPNSMIAFANTVMETRGRTLGIIVADGKSTRFHFAETGLSGGRSVGVSGLTEMTRAYLLHSYTNPIELSAVLAMAGARFVTSPQEADIDLSPEVITKGTLVNLISGTSTRELEGAR